MQTQVMSVNPPQMAPKAAEVASSLEVTPLLQRAFWRTGEHREGVAHCNPGRCCACSS